MISIGKSAEVPQGHQAIVELDAKGEAKEHPIMDMIDTNLATAFIGLGILLHRDHEGDDTLIVVNKKDYAQGKYKEFTLPEEFHGQD